MDKNEAVFVLAVTVHAVMKRTDFMKEQYGSYGFNKLVSGAHMLSKLYDIALPSDFPKKD